MTLVNLAHRPKLNASLSWIVASVICFLAATLSHSLQVQNNLIAVGAKIDATTRLRGLGEDLLGLGPSYLPIIAIGFAIAFFITSLIIKKTTRTHRRLLYALAGGVTMATILGLMQPIMEITLIAGARGWQGFLLQALAGVLGGLVYSALTSAPKMKA